LLLNFSKVRAIVNGSAIYQLEKNRSVVIAFATNRSTLVITDGYHYTKPLQITHQPKQVNYFTVVCAIDDDRLLAGAIVTTLLFLVGLTSGILFIRLISFVPIIYFLYLYYINRNNFIQVKAAS
jgi:hypothetical protein